MPPAGSGRSAGTGSPNRASAVVGARATAPSAEPYRLDRQSARRRREARPAHATTRSRRRIDPPIHERNQPKQPEPQHVSEVYAGCFAHTEKRSPAARDRNERAPSRSKLREDRAARGVTKPAAPSCPQMVSAVPRTRKL